MRRSLALLLALGLAGCGAAPTAEPSAGAIADYPRYTTAAELFERATLVVEGTTGAPDRRRYDGVAYDVWPVAVSRAWKGDGVAEGAVVEVKLPRQERQLEEDRAYLFFLETYPDVPGMPASMLNPDQGSYPLDASGAPTARPGNEVTVTAADLRRLSTRGP